MKTYIKCGVFLSLSFLSSCATMFSGSYDTVQFIGAESPLAFYRDSSLEAIPSEHSVNGDLHTYAIELDKSVESHTILVTDGVRQSKVDLRRKIDFVWLFPNLITYGLGFLVDVYTNSVYSFPTQDVRLALGDPVTAPPPIAATFVEVERDGELIERTKDSNRTLFISGSFIGAAMPYDQPPQGPTSVAISLGIRFLPTFFAAFEGSSSAFIQQIGSSQKRFETYSTSFGIFAHYQPLSFIFLSAGPSIHSLSFDRKFRLSPGVMDTLAFGRSKLCASIGGGFNLGGFMLEYRRYVGITALSTPDGPHGFAFSRWGLGFFLRLMTPGKE